MAKNRGNPNWGKPEVNTVPYAGASSFEEVVKKLRLSPTEYESSTQLKDWVRKNKDHKYVPSTLLQAWGLEVKGGIVNRDVVFPILTRASLIDSDAGLRTVLLWAD